MTIRQSGLIRHYRAEKQLRPRGALAPRNLFIGSISPFAQIFLVFSMKTHVVIVPNLRKTPSATVIHHTFR
jgi:hypothetical protein